MPTDTVFRIADDQMFDITIQLADRAGNPLGALPDGATATWSSSDPSIATVAQSPSDPLGSTVTTVGPLGTVQANVDVQLPDGGALLHGILNLEVVPGDAVSLKLNPANIQPRSM